MENTRNSKRNARKARKATTNYCLTMEDIIATENRSDRFAADILSRKEDLLCWSIAGNLIDNITERVAERTVTA